MFMNCLNKQFSIYWAYTSVRNCIKSVYNVLKGTEVHKYSAIHQQHADKGYDPLKA